MFHDKERLISKFINYKVYILGFCVLHFILSSLLAPLVSSIHGYHRKSCLT